MSWQLIPKMSQADRRRRRGTVGLAAGLMAFLLTLVPGMKVPPAGGQRVPDAEEALTNPYLGQKEAIEEGERIYRSRCVGCHKSQGGQGPNLFRTKLPDKQFLETVINGRKGGMPAWGSLLSRDEVWKVHAFVMSRDRL